MANYTFNSVEEFKDAMYRACKANDWWTPKEVFQELAARWATIKWIPVWWEDWFDFKDEDMDIILSWWEPLGGWNKRDLVEWEAWYDEWKKTHDKDLADKASFQDLTKEKWWWSKTWQEKLKIFADKYNKLLNETRDYVLKKYSGEWLTWEWREEFLKELYKKETALKELENSNEFKNLMLDLAEAWTWNPFDNWVLNWELNETLKLAASWAWSEMFKDKETLSNIVKAGRTSWVGKNIESFIKNWWWMSIIPWGWTVWWLYNMFAWEDAQDIAKEYVNKNGLTRESLMSDEEKENNKWKKLREKNPNVNINKATDKMLFWDDAASSWIDNYIDARDNTLATLLKVKWIESPEEIDKFLNQYPSWQNAKQKWKDETLKRLSEKVSNVKYDDVAKKVKASKTKKEDKKEEKREEKVWDNWTPSNDDSINGVEDESKTKKITDFLKWNKKISKEDLYSVLPDKAKQLIEWIDKEAKARLNAKEHIWDTDENWYRDPDSPINWTEEEAVESKNEKWWKWVAKEEKKQTSKNNKFLYITKEVQKLKPNERIKYLKEHWFSVDKNWYFTKNWMKTLVYKDGQYNPKYVKPNKEEWYNDRTLVEPKQDKFQIALQKSWYQWPRDANWNFLPMTDKWLDLQEAKKKESKTKK